MDLQKMKLEQQCKEDIEDLTNSMNTVKRKEIAKVESDKDDEKKRELELHDVKTTA
jgi:hypothetical protein